MPLQKTLQAREQELRSLLTTAEGRDQIQQLETRYTRESGRSRPTKASVITYILVHEREKGIVQG
jgi:hypothetical protein